MRQKHKLLLGTTSAALPPAHPSCEELHTLSTKLGHIESCSQHYMVGLHDIVNLSGHLMLRYSISDNSRSSLSDNMTSFPY